MENEAILAAIEQARAALDQIEAAAAAEKMEPEEAPEGAVPPMPPGPMPMEE
jgi:hypothetical protein